MGDMTELKNAIIKSMKANQAARDCLFEIVANYPIRGCNVSKEEIEARMAALAEASAELQAVKIPDAD